MYVWSVIVCTALPQLVVQLVCRLIFMRRLVRNNSGLTLAHKPFADKVIDKGGVDCGNTGDV